MAISQNLLNDGESVVISTRTHPKALLVPVLALVLLLAVGVVWWVLRPLLVWASASYTFTDRRLITRTGVLTRHGHDIPLSRISDVASELGLVDRMLGCGTLIISDASTHGSVRLPDIPHVEDTQRRLNLLLSDLDRSAHDGT